MKKLNKLKKLAVYITMALVIISVYNTYMIHHNLFERFESMHYRWLEAGVYLISASLWLYIFLKQEMTMGYVGIVLFSFLIGFTFCTTLPYLTEGPMIRIYHFEALCLFITQTILVSYDLKKRVNQEQTNYQ